MNANPDTRASQSAANAGPSKISTEERQARVALAALYRLVALHGWDDMIFTHISARVPGPEHHFLINPYGWFFDEITASCLVKVDLQGKKVDDDPQPINPAGDVGGDPSSGPIHPRGFRRRLNPRGALDARGRWDLNSD